MSYTMLTIKNIFCLHICMNYTEFEKDLKINKPVGDYVFLPSFPINHSSFLFR